MKGKQKPKRRGAKPAKAKVKVKVKAKRPAGARGLAARLTESLEQQAATAEILRVISSSPTDARPVFETIAKNARRLCKGDSASVLRLDGTLLHLETVDNATEEGSEALRRAYPSPVSQRSASGRAVLTGRAVHIPDVLGDPGYEFVGLRGAGLRSILSVPMLRHGTAIGAITVHTWATARPFSSKQIELLQTFADQAVIAIENVRLFTDLGASNRHLTEALEQQTATSEILRVMSGSPTDVQPVLDAVAESAARLCGATDALIHRVEGSMLRYAAHHGTLSSRPANEMRPVTRDTASGRAVLERRTIHVDDMVEELARGNYLEARPLQATSGFRTILSVPLLHDDAVIGVIAIRRDEVRPFTAKQMELVQTFAAQAAIAIENVRLFSELQASNGELTTALDTQTATSDILRVISRSQTDVQPVFDAIVASAVRLLGAYSGSLSRLVGDQIELAALSSTDPGGDAALRARFPRPLHSATGMHPQALRDRAPFNVADADTDPRLPEEMRAYARVRGHRSMVAVPMLLHDEVVGAIAVTRREAGGFTDDEIALLQTFADQAVIAIENVRLFTELREKNEALTVAHAQVSETLEQQTATAEILRVISSSPTDVQPVFDVIVERAVRLCGAQFGRVYRFDDGVIHMVAGHGLSPVGVDELQRVFPRPASDDTIAGRVILSRQPVFVRDIERDEGVPALSRAMIEALGTRSQITIPMLRAGEPIGAMSLGWAEPEAFDEQQIALVKTFADQAVIAIENVRLFKELEGRNRDLTATSEILRVISSSPTDVQPVFDTIVRSAMRLCDGLFSALYQFDGELIHPAAQHNYTPEALEEMRRVFPVRPTRGLGTGRAILDRAVVHIPDVEADPEFLNLGLTRAIGFRSGLFVPMLREGVPLGVIVVARAEAGPFSDNEIGLLKTFADQAIIAVENVRLFKELQASNRNLTSALDTQTATSDILRVVSRSQTNVQPVFDAIVASAVRLLGAYAGGLTLVAGDQIELAALTGHDDAAGAAAVRATFPRSIHSETPHAQAIRDRVPLNIAEYATDPRLPEAYRASAAIRGYRSLVVVPLLRHDEAIGAITVTRRGPGGFTDDEIALLKTFADQAVIAIENARLLSELKQNNEALTQAHAQVSEALEQQTATAEILRVISSSPTDVQPVFDTIVRSAVRLCDALFSALFQLDGELIHLVAQYNYAPEALEEVHRIYPARPTRALLTGRAILERALVHVPDIELDPEWPHQALTRAVGFRSGLWVPMLREGVPIGVIAVARAEPGPFSASEIELLKTFADQAVIAIENVRLFTELEARTGELTQSVEKLTALGEVSRAVSSTLDVETVLDTIVSRASQLAGAAGCSIYEYDAVTQQFELRANHHDDPKFVEALRAAPLRKGEGLMGRAAEMREPIQIPDISQPGAYQSSVRDTLIRFGYRALLAVPLLREDQIIGSLSFNRKTPGEFPPEIVDVLKTFATQSALAIQNARLFREIADKSRQLEVASQHKSEFLANMSHELRTPLNAIIGFSEVLNERMFGELNEKQAEYSKDIHASGQHLLSLINDILDLSKVEAGRMELELTDFDLPAAVDNAVTLVRERANRKGITVRIAVEEQLGMMRGDERKIRQVLLNLLSNAIKFTPEGGRIEVAAVPKGGSVEVSVHDTGVGIAPEDHEAVFEEFRQVGASAAKQEGTGLGLALARKFIELHGGKIWVTSQVGAGSTFTFTLPLRQSFEA